MSDEETEPPAETLPDTLPERLAGGRFGFVLTADLAERWDLYIAAGRTPTISVLRVWAAAIALCWPKLRAKLAAAGIVYDGDVVRYGGKVQGILMAGRPPAAAPVTSAELRAVGEVICRRVAAAVLDFDAVKAKADFLEAPGGDSSGTNS
jgi:hypothetical protein